MTARFETPLRVQVIDGTFVSLDTPLAYASPILGGLLTVPVGFVTDFDSTPRWLPIAYAVIKGTGSPAAVVHDWLYQTHRADLYAELGPGFGWAGPEQAVDRATADDVLAEALGALEVAAWKIRAMVDAVRAFGGSSYASGPTRFRVNNRALLGVEGP